MDNTDTDYAGMVAHRDCNSDTDDVDTDEYTDSHDADNDDVDSHADTCGVDSDDVDSHDADTYDVGNVDKCPNVRYEALYQDENQELSLP